MLTTDLSYSYANKEHKGNSMSISKLAKAIK